jgi:hypothetical protein
LRLVSGSVERAGAGTADAAVRIDQGSVVRRAAGSWALVDERVVVRASHTSFAVALDPVSSVVWRCLDGTSALGDVLADVADAFEVPVRRAADELIPVVASWTAQGLVDLVGSAADQDDEAQERGRRWRRLVDPPNG